MKHKNLFLLAAALVVLSSCCAYAGGARTGVLTKSQSTSEELSKAMAEGEKLVIWDVNEHKYDAPNIHRYYDNLAAMLLALNAGEIDVIPMNRPVAEYLIAQNPNLEISGVIGMSVEVGYVFGFLNDEKGQALREKFNEALSVIRSVGRLDKLKAKYLVNPGAKVPEVVKFPLFPEGETLKVAVTGDVPPLDYTTADGKAAGFNTALLAEIGKHLGCNIELVQVETAARVPALTSGRADVVFWFTYRLSDKVPQDDVTSDVIVSAPYYTTDLTCRVTKK